MRHVTAAVAVLAVALTLPAPARAGPRALVGSWALAVDPSTVLVLRADGSGSLAGERIRWRLEGDRLAVTDARGQTDVNRVRVDGDTLALIGAGGATVVFGRVGGGAPREAPAAKGAAGTRERAAPAGGGGSADDRRLRELLLSSAWCSFSYRATPGGGGYGDHTSSSRVVFRPDGTGSRGSTSETYSTGTGGQYAGAGGGGERFRWAARGGRLLVDAGAGLQDVNLSATRNSNGYPILKAGGVEYMTCR